MLHNLFTGVREDLQGGLFEGFNFVLGPFSDNFPDMISVNTPYISSVNRVFHIVLCILHGFSRFRGGSVTVVYV